MLTDINHAFLRKFSADIVLTSCATLRSVTRENVINARRNLFGPKMAIDDYVHALRSWKYFRAMENADDYNQFQDSLTHIRSVPNDIVVIFDKIARKWFADREVTYALPETIESFKQGKIDFAQYVNSFITRKNPFI